MMERICEDCGGEIGVASTRKPIGELLECNDSVITAKSETSPANRRDGEEQWLLIHIEIQGYPQESFERRMYVYNYRIFDRYRRDVVSLAVLTDEDERFRPGAYQFGFGDFWHEMKFPTVKLLDYRERWEELEESENPFSVVVMGHLKAQETRRRVQARLDWKLRLTRRLYERGYGREEVLGLYRFIDWIIRLPEVLEESQELVLEQIENREERADAYVALRVLSGIVHPEALVCRILRRRDIMLESPFYREILDEGPYTDFDTDYTDCPASRRAGGGVVADQCDQWHHLPAGRSVKSVILELLRP